MSAEQLLHFDSELPEWRRSGRFFLIAIGLHAAVLAYPLGQAISRLDIPPPGPLTVKLIEALHPAPTPQPVAAPTPQAAPVAPATPKPRPVLAMTPEQQAPSASTPTVAAPPLAAPEPAARAASNPGPATPTAAPITAARFNAAYLNNPEPKYPLLSRRLGEEGKVLLKVKVSSEGLAATVDLEKSSNFDRLDEAARQAVARWRFIPAKRGDEPIEASVIVPIVFRLDS
ncbi:MAG: outer rane transport energization protein TonB [Proteobacteria bacterium]|nr:outer rane transport energization protein TonB [Pseudomonadota bacterium]